jgi:hypothetical protein
MEGLSDDRATISNRVLGDDLGLRAFYGIF